LHLTKYGLEPVTLAQTDHYRLLREFSADPKSFIDAVLDD
jgi:predicted ATPase